MDNFWRNVFVLRMAHTDDADLSAPGTIWSSDSTLSHVDKDSNFFSFVCRCSWGSVILQISGALKIRWRAIAELLV